MDAESKSSQNTASKTLTLKKDSGGLALARSIRVENLRLMLNYEAPVQLANRAGYLQTALADKALTQVDYETGASTVNSTEILPVLMMFLMHTTSVLLRTIAGESQESIKKSLNQERHIVQSHQSAKPEAQQPGSLEMMSLETRNSYLQLPALGEGKTEHSSLQE